jgi:hypothetical protein
LAADSILDTARWCRILLAQLTDDPTVFQSDSEGAAIAGIAAMAGFTAALSTVKKGNKTPEGTATAMLSAIPGLGAKRCEALLSVRSIAELAAMEVAAIADLEVGGKRLGPKLAEGVGAALRFRR